MINMVISKVSRIFRRKKFPMPLIIAILLVASALLPLSIHSVAIASGPTEIPGEFITGNITWTLADSPYIITGNVLVDSGGTLTIEPGVTIRFDYSKTILVNGELIAQGTELNHITFTSNQPTPTPGYWWGIQFSNSSVDANYDSGGVYVGGSILQYCVIEYAGSSNFGAVRLNGSSPYIDHCNIRNNRSNGIEVGGSTSKITNNTISGNTADSYGGGILGGGGSLTIEGNNITGNSASSGYMGGGIYYHSGTIAIVNNTINNNNGGDFGGGVTFVDCSATSMGNIIEGNQSLYGGGIAIKNCTAIVTNNTISENSSTKGGGIYIDSNTYDVTIVGNAITSNNAAYGGGIWLCNGTININNNDITGNNNQGLYFDNGTLVPNIHYNNIYGNTPYNAYNYRNNDVDCTNNWWGTSDAATIRANIYDWFDDAYKGFVNYSPYLTSEVDTPVTPPVPEMPTIILFGVSIIGIVGYIGFKRFRHRYVGIS